MPLDLSDHLVRQQLVHQMYADLERVSQELFADDDPRTYMGASVIGDDCRAKIWGDFRWLSREKFTGQKLRLFNRGHLEEPRFIKLLRGMGFEVKEHDENGEQFGMIGCRGHFGGHLDGLCKAPERYQLETDLIILDEYKSHNEKSYAKLAGPKDQDGQYNLRIRHGGQGVKLSKPQHFDQMCCYGRTYNCKYGLYVAVNKETDEIYFEIVPLDWNNADNLFRKADILIRSQRMPQKIAETETFWKCKGCSQIGVCHRKELPPKSCRSCVFAVPEDDGKWQCTNSADCIPATEKTLSKERQKVGCDHWKPIANA